MRRNDFATHPASTANTTVFASRSDEDHSNASSDDFAHDFAHNSDGCRHAWEEALDEVFGEALEEGRSVRRGYRSRGF